MSVEWLKSDLRLEKDEIKKVESLLKDEDKLATLFETDKEFKDFIYTDYKWANEYYLWLNNNSVIDLQDSLWVNVDWFFGEESFFALIRFQKAHGLTVDWLAGDKTQKVLFWETSENKKEKTEEKTKKIEETPKINRSFMMMADARNTEEEKKIVDLSNIDFRFLRNKYPNEASIKNNNPAWLTWNSTFANSLTSHGIDFYKWTSRPSSEWWNYFWFRNMEEWMNAFNLLWEIKLKKLSNKTFWDFAKNWAVDTNSYRKQFWDIWNKKISTLDNWHIEILKSKQMKIESPWMYKELSKLRVS